MESRNPATLIPLSFLILCLKLWVLRKNGPRFENENLREIQYHFCPWAIMGQSRKYPATKRYEDGLTADTTYRFHQFDHWSFFSLYMNLYAWSFRPWGAEQLTCYRSILMWHLKFSMSLLTCLQLERKCWVKPWRPTPERLMNYILSNQIPGSLLNSLSVHVIFMFLICLAFHYSCEIFENRKYVLSIFIDPVPCIIPETY